MKVRTVILASILTLGSTYALAQFAQSSSNAGVSGGNANKGLRVNGSGTAKKSQQRSGSAITTGSEVPQDKPNLSGSPASSDTSQKVK
jgi:hypothetical protein